MQSWRINNYKGIKGHIKTNVTFAFYSYPELHSSAVAVRACVVSIKDVRGVQHSVEVTGETLYEAAANGLSMLRQDEWAAVIGPGTELEVRVKAPETTHRVTVSQIQRWCDGVAVSPDEVLKRRKVKALLVG